MKKEIRYRLNGLEGIIHKLHHNLELMEYISYNLHNTQFNLFNNSGLYWIWGQTMGNQIIDFYKVVIKDEKFSFAKIINIARDLKCNVDYELLEKKTKALKDEYDKTNFETVRSKHLAHQDLRVPVLRGDLRIIRLLTEKTIDLFLIFSKEFKGRKVKFSKSVASSFREIFDMVDEYGSVGALLIAEQIKGNDTVKISKIRKIVKEHQRTLKKRDKRK